MKSLFVAALMLLPSSVLAQRRFAVIVGHNNGKPGQQDLQYAEHDARRIASILGSVGRFHPADIILLTGASAEGVREAFEDVERRIAGTPGGLLFVFYSGHADGAALNLGRTQLPLDELKELVTHSSADARIMVIDACRSGILTRVKGGWPGPAFEVPADEPNAPKGIAILASSAAGEEAQESEELGASFFTHYFASALLGAADQDGDLEVTLGETFTYAAERTIAATNATMVGPQHPTYRVELSGRHDLVLTSLAGSKDGIGILEFTEAGGYLIERASEARTVAEVAIAGGQSRRLAVESGRYRVTRREPDYLLTGEFDVESDARTHVRGDDMSRIAYARMVRKGSIYSAVSVLAIGGMRTPINDGGVAWRVGAGGRYDLRDLAIEARVELGGATQVNDRVRISSREVAISLLGLHAFDVGPLTLQIGLELGGVWLHQRFDDAASARNNFGANVGPIGMIELPVGRFSVRLELALPLYLLRTGNDPAESAIGPHIAFRSGLGFGLYF